MIINNFIAKRSNTYFNINSTLVSSKEIFLDGATITKRVVFLSSYHFVISANNHENSSTESCEDCIQENVHCNSTMKNIFSNKKKSVLNLSSAFI